MFYAETIILSRMVTFKCPNCSLPMDFVGRYILDVRLESAAPSHLKDFEAWR